MIFTKHQAIQSVRNSFFKENVKLLEGASNKIYPTPSGALLVAANDNGYAVYGVEHSGYMWSVATASTKELAHREAFTKHQHFNYRFLTDLQSILSGIQALTQQHTDFTEEFSELSEEVTCVSVYP